MSEVPSINGTVATAAANVAPARTNRAQDRSEPPIATDRVEISETGQLLSALDPTTDVRAALVAAIRQAIADGTYETEDKLEYTAGRLLEVLRTPE
jgi:flagellar biosynthesis anti-sigma factor FlgM